MNSVFENIIEKLEEMIHPKQLYFCKYARGGCKHLDNDDKDCMECVVENAIEIVKQEAVEYNNGWIPCSELLPAYGQTVLASVCAEDAEWKIIIACYKEEDFWLDGKIDAWQPLPEPYNPTGMNRAKTKDGKYEPYLGGWK